MHQNGYNSDMELLDRLESRIDSLLTTIEALSEENRRLKEEVDSGLSALADENRELKESLEQERTTREAVLARMDNLLAKLKTHTGEE
ncbi:hypothetical protein Dde_0980 [Oleidesulfovibrio alaskensis G20]|jgi:cell division protein ZapB|uniref:Cell division protein ZapB n=2 Tax=Oleidesulfovibrio alaskensis TaxID=58180 RepID=Q313W5_OLEA2|nr:hypothetical protein Dde_0980 [Oleidesulfovibrio alaskensis G20]